VILILGSWVARISLWCGLDGKRSTEENRGPTSHLYRPEAPPCPKHLTKRPTS
jgi:hypothetical protein